MRTEGRTEVKNSVGRLIFVAVSVLVQVGWFLILVLRLNEYSVGISIASGILALCAVLAIYGKRINAAYKMPWIMLILAFPVLGLSLYLLAGRSGVTRRMQKRFAQIDAELDGLLRQDEEVMERLERQDMTAANQARYLSCQGGYPVWQDTDVVFYADAADGLAAQKEAMEKAQKFIFMEYHAIEDAESFEGVRTILAKKARQGVEVRVIYDDVGSIGFINPSFIRRMEAEGIACRVFNPLMPVANVFMNNRDHRKITVIDGQVGFTGGYNLADEYFIADSANGGFKHSFPNNLQYSVPWQGLYR